MSVSRSAKQKHHPCHLVGLRKRAWPDSGDQNQMFALKRLEPPEVRVWDGGGGSSPPLQPARWTEGDAAVGQEATQCCVTTAMSCLRQPPAAWLLSSSLPTRAWVTASCTGLAIRGAPGVLAFYPQAPQCRHLVLKYPELEPRTLHSSFFPGKGG